jgi:RNA polymerase sigma-70 factor (ECF subfamily)
VIAPAETGQGGSRGLSQLHDELEQLRERIDVMRAQAGDRAAFGQLVSRYQERLMYYVHRLIEDRHQSQDVLQEIWLDVFRKLGQLRSPAAFRVWLYRCAHSRSIHHLRRRRSDSHVNDPQALPEDAADCWNELALLENVELVHSSLEKLSPEHREVMVLRFLEGMDVKEIAEVVECNEGTAKSRLHYAKVALRRIIEEERGDG